MDFAIKEIISKKKDISITAVNNCSHIGRLSDYLEELSDKGYISIIFCNGGGPNSAIFPSAKRICGTNPFGFGMPVNKKDKIIVDFSTSMLAEGKVRINNIKNKKLKYNAIINKKGIITNNPKDFYNGGALLPFGDKKGSGLMLTCEILGGLLLSGNNPLNRNYQDGNNCSIIAFKKKLFNYNKNNFTKQFNTLVKKIHNEKKLKNVKHSENYLPGEWENKNIKKNCNKKGVNIDLQIINEIKDFIKINNLKIKI